MIFNGTYNISNFIEQIHLVGKLATLIQQINELGSVVWNVFCSLESYLKMYSNVKCHAPFKTPHPNK